MPIKDEIIIPRKGDQSFEGDVLPGTDGRWNVGSLVKRWASIYAKKFVSNVLETDIVKSGILSITDGVTAPSGVSGQASIYVDTSDSILKARHGTGTPVSLESQGGLDTNVTSNSSGTTIGTSYTTLTSHSVTVGSGQKVYLSAFLTVLSTGWTSNDYVAARIYDGTYQVVQRLTVTANGIYYPMALVWVNGNKTGTFTVYLQIMKNSTSIGGQVPQYYGVLNSLVYDEV